VSRSWLLITFNHAVTGINTGHKNFCFYHNHKGSQYLACLSPQNQLFESQSLCEYIRDTYCSAVFFFTLTVLTVSFFWPRNSNKELLKWTAWKQYKYMLVSQHVTFRKYFGILVKKVKL
jgi:hypothetical protein